MVGCILDRDIVISISNYLKLSGKKVVFTHGAYDLFHIGHMEFLRESKKLGDYIIVGVEGDKRIAKYKSVNRPIIPLKERMEIIASMGVVDFVMPIDDSMVVNDLYYEKLYEDVNPSVLAFGRDFHAESKIINRRADKFRQIQFKKILHKYDGLQSTTSIIETIKAH